MDYTEYSVEDLAEEYNTLERQETEARKTLEMREAEAVEAEPWILNELAKRLGLFDQCARAATQAEKANILNEALTGYGIRLDA